MADLPYLLEIPLDKINRMGLLTTKKISKQLAFAASIIIPAVLFVTILIILQYFYMEDNVEHYVDNFVGTAVCVQCVEKWISCWYHKYEFLTLINYCADHFWTAAKCSENVERNIQKLSNRVRRAQKLFIQTCLVSATFALILSAITKSPPAGHWSMENQITLYKIFFGTISVAAYIIVLSLAFYDTLYLGFCYEVIVQCKILCNHLELLNIKEIKSDYDLKRHYKKMQNCIKHHSLLLRFHAQLQKIYSVPFMLQHVTATPFICAAMYTLLEGSSFHVLVVYIVYFITVTLQLSIYCVSSNFVTDELLLISDAIYNSDWYSQHFLLLRTPTVLLIQRAQQKVTFSACGLIQMDIPSLVQGYKFCFSACLALRHFKD